MNSILTHIAGASEIVKLHLMENYCYPVLTYALECFNLSSTCIQQLGELCRLCRKIFTGNYKPWTSVRELIYCVNRMDFEYFFSKETVFLHNMIFCKSSIDGSVMCVPLSLQKFLNLQVLAHITRKIK